MKITLPLTAVVAVSLLAPAARADDVRVYFGTSDSKGIYFAAFDTDKGELSTPQLAIEIDRPGFLAIHPNKKFIYATSSGLPGDKDGGVAALAIHADGTLKLLNKQSSRGQGPCHVSVDATGSCVLVANYGSGSVAALKIAADGSLEKSASAHQHEGSGANKQRQEGPHAHSIYPNPANTFAYAPDLGIDKVMIYKLAPKTATLTAAGAAVVPGGGRGPRHMKFSRDGKHAYVLNELGLSVALFGPAEEAGQLAHRTSIPTLADDAEKDRMSCSEVRIHPNGNFVYAANRDIADRGRDAITVFRAASSKAGFARLAVVPAEVSVPRNFNLDPTGRWMLVGGQRSHDVAIFQVDDKTGQLKFTGRKIPFDGGPICIEFLP